MSPLQKKFLCAGSTISLLYSRQIAGFDNKENLFNYFWHWTDSLAILASIVLLTLLAVGADEILEKRNKPRLRKLLHHGFLFLFFQAVISNVFPITLGTIAPTREYANFSSIWIDRYWLAVCSYIAYSLGTPRKWTVKIPAMLSLALSPFMLFLLIRLFSFGSLPVVQDSISKQPATDKPEGTPVFVFIFDAWSSEWCFDKDGRVRDEYPNLQAFTQDALSFPSNYTPAVWTVVSVPKVLKGKDCGDVVGGAFSDAKRDETNVNLFKVAKEAGAVTIAASMGLPYRTFLPDHLDVNRNHCLYKKGTYLPEKMLLRSVYNGWYYYDAISRRVLGPMEARLSSRHTYDSLQTIRDDYKQVIREYPSNTLGVFHLLLPHAPFLYDETGNYTGHWFHEWGGLVGKVEDYEVNLKFQDHVMGEIVDELKKAGKYEDALLVFTSDHGWRFGNPRSPGVDTAYTHHVPLFVKLPGHGAGETVQTNVYSQGLNKLIHEAYQGNVDRDRALEILKDPSNKPALL